MKKPIVERQTVTAYKASNRPSYCTTFRDPRNNRRVNRSLGTTDPTEAKDICVSIERIVNDPRLWKIRNPRLHAFHDRAISILFPNQKLPPINKSLAVPAEWDDKKKTFVPPNSKGRLGFHVDSAEYNTALLANVKLREKVARLERDIAAVNVQNTALLRASNKHVTATLSEAVAKWQQVYPTGRKPHTVAEAFSAVNSFKTYSRPGALLGQMRAGHIDAWLVEYRNPQTDAEVTAVTKRRVRAYVSAFFSWAVREYDLVENPMAKTGPVPGLARHPENIRAIRRHEDLTLLIDSLEKWPLHTPRLSADCNLGLRLGVGNAKPKSEHHVYELRLQDGRSIRLRWAPV